MEISLEHARQTINCVICQHHATIAFTHYRFIEIDNNFIFTQRRKSSHLIDRANEITDLFVIQIIVAIKVLIGIANVFIARVR